MSEVRQQVRRGDNDESMELRYHQQQIIGNGSFGLVFQARIVPSGEEVAIKRVLQDRRFKNRELEIMRNVRHVNIVSLHAYFFSTENEDVYLNLVLEYMPGTVDSESLWFTRARQSMPNIVVKLFTYQLFRSLCYIHSLGICHRDIKPSNLLCDPRTGILKLCDFGSAKVLVWGEPNVSYICSRYYRAPELIFGAVNYTTKIDVWSGVCVMAELMLGKPLFPGGNGIDQLVEIIKVLGTPTREQIKAMNPHHSSEQRFPQIRPHPLARVFKRALADAIDLLKSMLEYSPEKRPTAIEVLTHPYFDELRNPDTTIPNWRSPMESDRALPPLFNFTEAELNIRPDLRDKLVPSHIRLPADSAVPATPAPAP